MDATANEVDVQQLVGVKGETRRAHVPAHSAICRIFCSSIGDANPKYWGDPAWESKWGAPAMPLALISTFGCRLPWTPEGDNENLHLVVNLPLPGATVINASSDTEYFRPFLEGDILESFDEVTAIGPEKSTRIGIGNFVTTVTTFSNQHGELIARNTNTVFCFNPHD